MDTIAVLGAGGTMGLPMARNLARAGFTVRAWNRSADKARPLADDGAAELFDSPAEAAEGAGIVLTMLSDGPAVLDVMEDVRGDAVWLQMSTVGLEATERCIELAADRGLTLVDAPVVGTKKPAEDGELVVLAAGAENVRERAGAVFDAVGRKTVWLADEPGAATRLKVVINSWIVSVVEGAAETLALAEGLGIDPAQVLETLAGGPLDLPYLQLKGKAMIAREFPTSFSLALAAKDAGLAVDAAASAGLELPVLAAIRDRLAEGAEKRGDEDLAATFLTSAPAQT